MYTKEQLRGWAAILVVIAGIALLAVFARPRVQEWMAGSRQPQKQRGDVLFRTDTLFMFDPNTVTYEELRMLGLDKSTAANIIRRRSRGIVYYIPEDFAESYGMDDATYLRLKPYIRIDSSRYRDTVRYTRRSYGRLSGRDSGGEVVQKADSAVVRERKPFERFRIDTVTANYLWQIGFTMRQAYVLIDYRNRGGGIRNICELRDCRSVSDEMADALEGFVIFSDPDPYGGLVEINSADSVALRSVSGIGEKSVAAIIQYRRLLGGFYSVDQLAELHWTITPDNFRRIITQICCDSCKISKIDINFAPADELKLHPYINSRALERIERYRNLKGGWNSVEEMIETEIFSREEAKAIAPYLLFVEHPIDFD